MSIFGLDEVAPGGMWGAPAPIRRQAQAQVPRTHSAIGYASLIKEPQSAWDRIYNEAYMGAHDQRIHLGNVWAMMNPDNYAPKPEKRTRNLGFDWQTGKIKEEEYWHTPDFDRQMFHDTVIRAVKQGQADRVKFDELNKVEADTWAQQDKEKADLDALEAKNREIAAALERRSREMQEQAKYQAALHAAQSARQQTAASQSVKKFAHDPSAAYGGGGNTAASQKMLSHKGLDNDHKLGRDEKLGKKSLLGA